MSGGIINRLRKWRHTKGYGVHSPLAYTIVKECLYPDPRYGLYSDSFIDFEFNEDRKIRRDAKRLVRLINILKPEMVWMPGGDRRIAQALRISFPEMKLATQKTCPKGVDLIVEFRGNDTHAYWQSARGIVCFGSDSGTERRDLKDATLKISGKDYCILIRREGMERTEYELL